MINITPKIVATENPQQSLEKLLASVGHSRLAVVVDENTFRHCLPLVDAVVGEALIITIPSGEENKNIDTCTVVWEALTKANFDRKALLLNLGGGVIGDLGGFCAATYKRGIRFINIPTTLLSQVDASVGGKLGVDFLGYKNQIGIFQEPEFVLISPEFLKTLSEKELLSGYAEVVKHALIADNSLWQQLNKNSIRDIVTLEGIATAVNIKCKIVEQDFLENNERKLLNFGHTLGHAVESYLLRDPKRKILHGEAVAAGMLMEAWISMNKNLLNEEKYNEIEKYILDTFPFINITLQDINDIAGYLLQDKKNINGKLMFTLLKDTGEGIFDQEVYHKECLEAMGYYINLK